MRMDVSEKADKIGCASIMVKEFIIEAKPTSLDSHSG